MTPNKIAFYCFFLGVFFLKVHSQVPFSCDGTGYLVSAASNSSPSVITYVNAVNGQPTNTTLIVGANNYNFNGLAYNISDDFLYAINYTQVGTGNFTSTTGNILQIDSNGDVIDKGAPTLDPSDTSPIMPTWVISTNSTIAGFQMIAGTIGVEGDYYVFGRYNGGNDVFLVKIDLQSMTYTDIDVSLDNSQSDFAFSPTDGLLYGLKNGNIITTNPNTGVQQILTPYTNSNLGSPGAGGAWSNLIGEIFFYSNGSGNFYKYNATSNELSLINTVSTYTLFDATACFPSSFYKEIIQPSPYKQGDVITYKFTIVNGSPNNLIGTFNDVLDPRLNWIETSVNPTSPGGGIVSFNGQDLTISNILVPTYSNSNGQPTTFTVEVQIPENASTNECIPNSATFTNGSLVLLSDDPKQNELNDATEICISNCYEEATMGNFLPSQVGISTLNRFKVGKLNKWPNNVKSAALVLDSKEKGFVITRLSTIEIDNLIAEEGMLVWDNTLSCLKLYDGAKWSCIIQNCNIPLN